MKKTDYINWDEYFMGVAMLAAQRSKDPNTQVGACIASPDNIILSTGYNGLPMGCSDDEYPWEREGEETKYPYAIAKMAAFRGAEVILVSGPTALDKPPFVGFVPVVSAGEMFEAVTQRQGWADIIIMAAAVADYKPAQVADDKLEKKRRRFVSAPAADSGYSGMAGGTPLGGTDLCGFSMETRDLVENSRKKLEKKKVDLICANNLKEAGAGFGVDTNVLTLISAKGTDELSLSPKDKAANNILDRLLAL